MSVLRVVSADELSIAYSTVYKTAFPPAELKPLSTMLSMAETGRYQNLGFFDGATPVAYANLWLNTPVILLDYLCVPEQMRNKGIGQTLLEQLQKSYPTDTTFLIESEAPVGESTADVMVRRRLRFYARCGARLLGYDAALFGVHYRVLALGAERPESVLMQYHIQLYRDSFSPALFRKAVQIPYSAGDVLPGFDQWGEI